MADAGYTDDMWWRRADSFTESPAAAGARRFPHARAGLAAATEAGDAVAALRLARLLAGAGETPDYVEAGVAKWFELGNIALIQFASRNYPDQLEVGAVARGIRAACEAGEAATAQALLFDTALPIAPAVGPGSTQYPPVVVDAVREGCTAACQRGHYDVALFAVSWLETELCEGYAPEAFAASAESGAIALGLLNRFSSEIEQGDGPERVRRERTRLAWPMCSDK